METKGDIRVCDAKASVLLGFFDALHAADQPAHGQ
jgi:hypothetical protein